jgi:tRNA threonylcarbamoyladenosine biosynthesis protein TsaE
MNSLLEKSVSDIHDLPALVSESLFFAGESKIWAFYGDLGAGKTTFIRHLCEQIGVVENVSSPTFSLINEYTTKDHSNVYHFDFYRIESVQEAVDIGCVEYFESGSLCLIEWPEKILNLLPHPHIKIVINTDNSQRRFTFSYD